MDRCTVVVTGVGVVTSLGTDVGSLWSALAAGRNGIRRLNGGESDFGVAVGGPASPFDVTTIGVSRKLARGMDKASAMTVHAGLSALKDAGLVWPEDCKRYGVGAIVGAGNAFANRHTRTPTEDRSPKWFLETYPNLPLAYLSAAASLTGYGSTVVSACSSGVQAIGSAFRLIQEGREKIMLAGAVDDKFVPEAFSGFRRLGMCSPAGDPELAIRPFDRGRNGFAMGQGAGFLVLESLQNATSRGMRPLCRVAGFGSCLSAESLTDASRQGMARSMQSALRDAALGPEDIDHINAHGTGTVSNDREESMAIKAVFGSHAYRIPISSTKSMLGHTFAACGAVESVVCVASLQNQRVHPTRNFQEGDEHCDLDYVPNTCRDLPLRYVMKNSSGIGGANATLILGTLG